MRYTAMLKRNRKKKKKNSQPRTPCVPRAFVTTIMDSIFREPATEYNARAASRARAAETDGVRK